MKKTDTKPADTKPAVELIDLRSITRDSDKIVSTVYLRDDSLRKHQWIRCGAISMRIHERLGTGDVSARLSYGVTDFEHDSAYAFHIPVIGLAWDSGYGVDSGGSFWHAWIEPASRREKFRVPSPGYDPAKLPDSITCEECEKPHLIVPEGYYGGPPHNEALFAKLRGMHIEIYTGPAHDADDE